MEIQDLKIQPPVILEESGRGKEAACDFIYILGHLTFLGPDSEITWHEGVQLSLKIYLSLVGRYTLQLLASAYA